MLIPEDTAFILSKSDAHSRDMTEIWTQQKNADRRTDGFQLYVVDIYICKQSFGEAQLH